MYQEFWNQLSDNYRKNCLAWRHHPVPAIPPSGDDWQSVWTANPDLLTRKGRTFLYYRGSGQMPGREGDHDRIGVAEVLSLSGDGIQYRVLNQGQPVVDVGEAADFDGTDALDPATVFFQDQVFLYYSAIGPGDDSVGLAISDDGISFRKHGRIMTGRAPDVVVYDDRLRMVYQRPDANGNYQVFLAESADGLRFTDIQAEPVLRPRAGSWDRLSIATVRLGVENGVTYALYGGSSYLADEPDFFGLARSPDLVDWEFHPGNPIFGCGAKGSIDGGAMWFPALYDAGDCFVLLYEGSPGKYGWDLNSAICMASLPRC